MITKILKLSAHWCNPCKLYATTFNRVKEMDEYKNIEFNELDIEDDDEGNVIVEKYQIRSVPTTLLLDEKDEVIYKLIGNIPEKDLVNTINNALNQENE